MSAAAPESVKLSLLCPVYLFKTLYYVVLSTHYKLFMLKKNCAISSHLLIVLYLANLMVQTGSTEWVVGRCPEWPGNAFIDMQK